MLLDVARLGGPIGKAAGERIFVLLYDSVDSEATAQRVLALAEELPKDDRLSPLARLKVQALLYDRLGRHREAADASLEVERLGVLDFDLLTIRLRAWQRLGEKERAERLERRLRELDPGFRSDPIPLPFGSRPGC